MTRSARATAELQEARRGRRLQAVPGTILAPVSTDPTFLRVRAAICDMSPVDLDGHAARITLDVLRARANPQRLPVPAWLRPERGEA